MTGEHTMPVQAGHAPYEELAVGFAMDALEPGEEETFLRHLPTCDRCQAEVVAHREVAAALVFSLPADVTPTISPALAEAMATRPVKLPLDPFVDAAPVRHRVATSHRRGRLSTPVRRVLVGAGALGLIAAIGLTSYDVDLRSHPATTASGAQAALQALSSPNAAIAHFSGSPASGSSATTVVADGHAYLVATGLPQTSSRSSYVLWSLGGTQPTAVRRFAAAGGSSPQVVDMGSAAAVVSTRYAVTLEPDGASAPLPSAPTGRAVLTEAS